jgi:hypothetical protein
MKAWRGFAWFTFMLLRPELAHWTLWVAMLIVFFLMDFSELGRRDA